MLLHFLLNPAHFISLLLTAAIIMHSLHAFSRYFSTSYIMYSKSNPAELQTLVHAHWNVAKTDQWLQLSHITPLYQMRDTKHEDNSIRKLYLKSPLALQAISNRATNTPVTYQLHSQPPCQLLTLLLEVCVYVTHTELCSSNRNVFAAHCPCSLQALHSPVVSLFHHTFVLEPTTDLVFP
jgi:hypothetical protein